ncbi:MAG: glycoside hydrolase family 24 protein [Aeromonas sp.]
MARIECSANVAAFLELIAFAEGTRWRGDGGYNVLVNPGGVFSDYTTHPNRLITVRPGLVSTAAGRYQFLSRHWPHYRDLLQLPDFGPASQDKWALQLLRERRALADVEAGRVEAAIARCCNIWASLPGAGYGQPEKRLSELVQVFVDAGGRLA